MILRADQVEQVNEEYLNSRGLMSSRQLRENAAQLRRVADRIRNQTAKLRERKAVSTVAPQPYRVPRPETYERPHNMKLPRQVPPIRLNDPANHVRSAAVVGPSCRCVCVGGRPTWVCG